MIGAALVTLHGITGFEATREGRLDSVIRTVSEELLFGAMESWTAPLLAHFWTLAEFAANAMGKSRGGGGGISRGAAATATHADWQQGEQEDRGARKPRSFRL